MDGQPRKRAWLQFHLSTAILMMFVAGGLLWANLYTYESSLWPGECVDPPEGAGYVPPIVWPAHGWPFCFYRDTNIFWRWHLGNLMLDGLIAFAILLLVAICSERPIRDRDVREP